jgi:hypothetical protein
MGCARDLEKMERAMILAFLATPLGRYLAGAMAAFVVFGAWLTTRDYKQQAIGAQKLAAKMEKASDENAKKAEAARRSVDALPPDRLRDKYFRDN